jgi:ASC-1-like (ASCH) protein
MIKETNKSYTLRFAVKNKETWSHIKKGNKKVETRAGTPKYQNVKAGDELILVCSGKRFSKKIKKVMKFKTIRALIKIYKPEIINPGVKTLKEMEAMYYSYPGYREKIKKYGVLAFELVI